MIAAIAIYLAVMAAAGCAIVQLLLPAMRGRALRTGLGLLTGAAACGLMLLLASLCGLPPSRPLLAALAMGAATVLMGLRARIAHGERERDHLPFGIVAVGIPVAAAAWLASTLPPEWDGFAIWLLKAKVLWLQALSPLPEYFREPALSYSHLDYPPLVPLLVAGMHAAVGRADLLAAHAVFVYLLLGLGCTCYGALRTSVGGAAAASLTLACFANPAFLRWAAAPLADMPLAAFHLASVVLISRFLSGEDGARGIVLAGFLGASAALTKLEGQPLALLVCAAMVIAGTVCGVKGSYRAAALLGLVQLSLVLPWLLLAGTLPRWHEDYAGRLGELLDPARFERLGADILPALGAQFTIGGRWGGLWLLPLLFLLPGWRALRHPAAVSIWCLLLAHLALYLLAYVISPWNLHVLLPMTLERLLLHMAPVVALLAGLHLAAALRTADAVGRQGIRGS